MTIYEEMAQAGVPMSNWQSDLYVPVTDQTRAILSRYSLKATMFKSNVDGRMMYDIPFAFDPFWSK